MGTPEEVRPLLCFHDPAEWTPRNLEPQSHGLLSRAADEQGWEVFQMDLLEVRLEISTVQLACKVKSQYLASQLANADSTNVNSVTGDNTQIGITGILCSQ